MGEIVDFLRAENKLLRKLLWLRHGCPVHILYGDDGEIQCGKCLIDFKRSPAEEIEAVFQGTQQVSLFHTASKEE